MKTLLISETANESVAEIRRRIQRRTLGSTFLMIAMMLALPILLSACGKSEWREVKAPETVDAAAPAAVPETVPTVATAPAPAAPAQVAPAPEAAPVAPAPVPAPAPKNLVPLVAVSVKAPVETTQVAKAPRAPQPRVADPMNDGEKQPVKPKTSSAVVREQRPITDEADRYVMIQNIATEKLRVYERPTVVGEPNRLIFETDLIAGENNPATTRRTALGSYRIEKWIKFYQDNQGLFPSWYDTTLTFMPLPGASLEDWTRPNLMPVINGQPSGLVRGAFGWYTAKIGPNAYAQWTHGTVGWGSDQDRFIKIPKSTLAQFYSDPRSYGCTRVENRAIAFLQERLPVGTRVLKVYAKESLADKTLARYKNQKAQTFEFALTNDEVRKEDPHTSLKAEQMLRAVPQNSVMEVGEYKIDSTPTPVVFKKTIGEKNKITRIVPEANLYDIPESSFHGEFLVDEGLFVGYKHPRELRLGGIKNEVLPSVVVK